MKKYLLTSLSSSCKDHRHSNFKLILVWEHLSAWRSLSSFCLWHSIHNELRNPVVGVLMKDRTCVCVCVCGLNTWHKEWAWEASTGRFGGGIARWVPVVVGCTGRRCVHLQHKHRNATHHSEVCAVIKTQLVRIRNSQPNTWIQQETSWN